MHTVLDKGQCVWLLSHCCREREREREREGERERERERVCVCVRERGCEARHSDAVHVGPVWLLSKCNSAETSCALQIWRCTPEMETLSGKHMNTLMVTRIFFMVVYRLCHASYMYIRTTVSPQNNRVVPPEHLVASALL